MVSYYINSRNSKYSSLIISSSYISGLIDEIKQINQNKQTSLNKIYIKTSAATQIDDNLDLQLSSFNALNWKIEKEDARSILLNRL